MAMARPANHSDSTLADSHPGFRSTELVLKQVFPINGVLCRLDLEVPMPVVALAEDVLSRFLCCSRETWVVYFSVFAIGVEDHLEIAIVIVLAEPSVGLVALVSDRGAEIGSIEGHFRDGL
jgi:hypothetical protein